MYNLCFVQSTNRRWPKHPLAPPECFGIMWAPGKTSTRFPTERPVEYRVNSIIFKNITYMKPSIKFLMCEYFSEECLKTFEIHNLFDSFMKIWILVWIMNLIIIFNITPAMNLIPIHSQNVKEIELTVCTSYIFFWSRVSMGTSASVCKAPGEPSTRFPSQRPAGCEL